MFTEDFATFFDEQAFAKQANIGGVQVRVIFQAASADPFSGAVDVHQPTCWAPTASVSHVAQGTSAVIDGTDYTVDQVTDDGTGVSRLFFYPAT